MYNRFNDTNNKTSLMEIIYRIKNGIENVPLCEVCGNPIPFKNSGYGKRYCGKDCKNSEKGRQIWKSTQSLTMLERYGVENPMESSELKQKQIENNIKKYSVSNVFAVEEVQEKIKDTNIERFGVEHPMKNKEVSCRSRNTQFLKYYSGTADAEILRNERRSKTENTCLKRYGVKHPLQYLEFIEKSKETCRENFGVDFYLQSNECKEEVRLKLQKFGSFTTYSQLEEVKQKTKETNLKRYGVEYLLMDKEFRKRCNEIIKERFHSSLKANDFGIEFGINQNMSKPEIKVLEILLSYFSKEDIVYNSYIDERYPFRVDFYIKGIDLFIEVNGHWTHGLSPYIETPENLIAIENAKKKNSVMYDKFIEVWSNRDPLKLKYANENNLNFIRLYGKNVNKMLEELKKELDKLTFINKLNLKLERYDRL